MLDNLAHKLKGRIVFLGVGNAIRGDDAFGVLLARALENRVDFRVFCAEETPENFLRPLIKENPDTVIFADAVDFSGEPGKIGLFDLEDFRSQNICFTHNCSFEAIYGFIREELPAVKAYLLAVQPKAIGLGMEMGAAVKESLASLERWFLEKYGRQP